MDDMNDLVKRVTGQMKGRADSPLPSPGSERSPHDPDPVLDFQRPAPPGLPSRAASASTAGADICPLCGGAGFLMDDLPLGHPDYGKALPCHCKLDERRSRQRTRFQGLHDLEALARFTFDHFNPELPGLPPHKRKNLANAFGVARSFAKEPKGWLLFTGGFGCGKTHLAAAIANWRLEKNLSAIFVVVPDLLDHLRTTFGPSNENTYDQLFDEVRNTKLLILDDLGVQSITPWAQEKLFQILNHRYNSQLPTVLTTNQRMEDVDQRLRSRLQDMNLVQHIHIRAPDYRAGADPGQGELSTLSLHAAQQFENFEARRRNTTPEAQSTLRSVRQAAEGFADNPQGWFVLLGENGVGKTHLAAAISNALRAAGQDDIMFVVVPDFLDYLRAAFNPHSPASYDRRFDELKRVPLLVLDDLGTESATPWAKEKLFQLLNYRHTVPLPTIITTSVAEKSLEPWLRTRIRDSARCQVWTIKTSSYRGSADQGGPLKSQRPRSQKTPRTYDG